MLTVQHQAEGFSGAAARMLFNERKVFSFHQQVSAGFGVSPSE